MAMAQLKNGINGPGKGKVGNVIMYEMYGKTYLRSKPAFYRDKKSVTQLAQRQRMTLVQNFLRHFNDLLRISMKEAAVGKSPYHAALSLNLKAAVVGEYPNQSIEPSRVILGQGSLETPKQANAKRHSNGIQIEWSTETNEKAGPYDVLLWAMKDTTTYDFTDFGTTSIRREDGRHLLSLPPTDKPVNIWIMFRSRDERVVSNSIWVGEV